MSQPIWAMALSAAVFVVGAYSWWYELDDPRVSARFADIHAIHPSVGKPLVKAKRGESIYFAAYEYGIVLYLPTATIHYVLPRDPDRPVIISNIIEVSGIDAKYFDDKWLRAHFKTPDDKKPPIGGIAYEMIRNASQWGWLGGREWQLNSSQAEIQYFENGLIIGPTPYSTDLKLWRNIAIIYNTKGWHQRNTSAAPGDAKVIP